MSLNWVNFYWYITLIFALIYGALLCLHSTKLLAIFQLGSYKGSNVTSWFFDANNKIFSVYLQDFFYLLSLFFIYEILMKATQLNVIYYFIMLILFIVILLFSYKNIKSMAIKKPIVYTARVKRLLVTMYLTNFILSYLFFWLMFSLKYEFILLLFALLVFLQIIVVIFCNYANFGVEKIIYYYYIFKAKKLLKKYKHLKIIGITGSFGKTSCKFILTHILKEKYFAICTPNSFNTPMGITKTILTQLKKHHEIFVVEMGADKLNDINKICNFIKPEISILTSVGNQHLKTFKNINNIVKTKYQIVENTNVNGLAIFNTSNEICNNLFNQTKELNKISVNLNNEKSNCYATNVVVNANGSEFTAHINNKNFKLKTKLLGEHNITNILLSVAVADYLGLTASQIQKAVASLQQIKSRLELIKLLNGALILDDSFNSNPSGCQAALKVLSEFSDRYKIIITPGMVELGDFQYEENFKFGKQMSGVANSVYIVNNVNKKAIYEGLISSGFLQQNIHFYETFNQAFSQVKQNFNKNHILLIENDLPDNYI